MTWMNEYDVENAVQRFAEGRDTPNLGEGAQALKGLVEWTNNHSDGWPYWSKPSQAAQRLQKALEEATRQYFRGGQVEDISEAELTAALRPIKAFLTKQGAKHEEVLS